jgi:hypothetical protein
MSKQETAGVLAAGDMFHKPAADTIATKTLPARKTTRTPTAAETVGSWCISGVYFGFDVAPAASEEFTIECPAATDHFAIPIGIAGVQNLDFSPALRFPAGKAVVIALSADDGGAIGYVGFKAVWIE